MRYELCTFDMARRAVTVVLSTTRRIEAPNWTPDGRDLLVNAEGRLYRARLSAPALVPVETGGLAALNNDHGVSPDGQTLAISDKTETGKSCIYLVEADGPARRVTREVPSWWHSWSPDGARLAYTAVREGGFCICTNSLTGDDEVRVAFGFDHADGPDYTPDGAWIWFNAETGGRAALWRVRPNGEDLEEMTFGPRVDWFPHPAPGGGPVVYLSYPPGTRGHPADLDVELRSISPEGGATERLLPIFGGQGTINVPSWAPAGGAFAFVRQIAPDTDLPD